MDKDTTVVVKYTQTIEGMLEAEASEVARILGVSVKQLAAIVDGADYEPSHVAIARLIRESDTDENDFVIDSVETLEG